MQYVHCLLIPCSLYSMYILFFSLLHKTGNNYVNYQPLKISNSPLLRRGKRQFDLRSLHEIRYVVVHKQILAFSFYNGVFQRTKTFECKYTEQSSVKLCRLSKLSDVGETAGVNLCTVAVF